MASLRKKPKPKRRWLTYSLRSFLLIVTIGCVTLGYWAHRASTQKAVVEWVKANGGRCYYDFEIAGDLGRLRAPKRQYPEWAHTLLGDDYLLANVVRIDLSPWNELHSKKSPSRKLKEIGPLAALDHLRYVDISSTRVSDLTPLAGLTRLEYLAINDTQANDLTPLAGLINLEHLSMVGTQVSDLTPLAGLTNLEFVNGATTQVGDLTPLARLTSLEYINISGTQVSDLAPLARLTSLEQLYIRGTQVTDLAPLARLTSLEKLDISGTQVTDLTPLAGVLDLESLRTVSPGVYRSVGTLNSRFVEIVSHKRLTDLRYLDAPNP